MLLAQIERYRTALEQVRDYLRSQDGPLYAAWESGDIANWDNEQLEWAEALDYIESPREGEGTEWDLVTGIVEVTALPVYRAVLAALEMRP